MAGLREGGAGRQEEDDLLLGLFIADAAIITGHQACPIDLMVEMLLTETRNRGIDD